ncbi:type II secretion system protein GspL [Aliidiomarina minuta]|nr:type II secretion system protein GspL [Aliidiomarina minuta]
MTKTLIIRLAGQYQRNVPWLLWDHHNNAELQSGTLESAAELGQLRSVSQGARLLVLCASTEIAFHTLQLPPGSRRHLAQVVPYALEEELAQDIAELHFCWRIPAQKDAPLPVAVVAKKQIAEWQSWLHEAGLEYQEIIPDLYMLPMTQDEWSAVRIDDDIIVRHEKWRGFAIEAGLFAELAGLFSDELEPPQRIRCWGEVEWPHAPSELVSAEETNPLSLALNIPAAGCIDLMQGDFKGRQKKNNQWSIWRWPAIAAAVLLTLVFAEKGLYRLQLQQQHSQLTAAIEQTYRDAFPDETRIVNVRAQLTRHLEQLQGGGGRSDVLRLLQQLAPAFDASELEVTLLQFDRNRNELRVQANAENFLAFERFQELAREQQLDIEQGQLTSRSGQIAGTLIIRSGS